MAIKKTEENREILGFKKLSVALIFIFEVILVFTFFDFTAHNISPDYGVPSWYFTNKIIYGTIIGFITYLFIRKKPIIQKSLILSAVVSILLQIRYFFIGYSISFVLSFLLIHFIILFIVSYVGFKITKM
ncbi:MAG TPA: hypothetical protein VI544_02085 [Candidatus Nanoarchaeia archaeon]|nr:hypothetical protein [Candidatus Nanoarchaeia archaeon]